MPVLTDLPQALQQAVADGLFTESEATSLPAELITAVDSGLITPTSISQLPAETVSEIDAGWVVVDPIFYLQPYSPKNEAGEYVKTQGQEEGQVPYPYGSSVPSGPRT